MASHAMTPISGTNGFQQRINFDPNAPLNLSVTNVSGQVRVSGANQNDIWVVVKRSRGNEIDDPQDIPIVVNVDGNDVSIHPDWSMASGIAGIARRLRDQLKHGLNPSDWDLTGLKASLDIEYDIIVELPRSLAPDSKVTVKTASGEFAVQDLTADVSAASASGRGSVNTVNGIVTVNSASGALTIDKITGSLEANSVSGAVNINGGEGWLAARSVSGKVDINDFTMKNARLSTVSGGVHVNGRAVNTEEYTVNTVSGSVNLDLELPANGKTTLRHSSTSGSARMSDEWTKIEKRTWAIGDGAEGPRFSVRTVSGSLRANARLKKNLALRNEPLPGADAFENDDDQTVDFSHESIEHHMKDLTGWTRDFANEFKGMADEFKRGFSEAPTAPTAPSPRTPEAPKPPEAPEAPTAPIRPVGLSEFERELQDAVAAREASRHDNAQAQRDAEQERLDAEQKRRDAEQAHIDAEQERRDAEQAPIDAEQKRKDAELVGSDADSSADAPIETAAEVETARPLSDDDQERLRILEALERGEIDIDEAMARLEPEDARES